MVEAAVEEEPAVSAKCAYPLSKAVPEESSLAWKLAAQVE